MTAKIIFTSYITCLIFCILGFSLGLDFSRWWPVVIFPGGAMITTMLVSVWKEKP